MCRTICHICRLSTWDAVESLNDVQYPYSVEKYEYDKHAAIEPSKLKLYRKIIHAIRFDSIPKIVDFLLHKIRLRDDEPNREHLDSYS